MRVQILAFSAIALGGNAFAGSIDEIRTNSASRSIEHITCVRCVTIEAPKKQKAAELAPGTQRIEVRNVNGELKVFRTEAWMGGSPVTYVSKAPEGTTAEAAVVEPAQSMPLDEKITLDGTKTSAVTADMGAATAVPAVKKPFDPNSLQLRLN